jgi:hypothetical protein
MTVRCGNKIHDSVLTAVHHHETVAKVRLCFARTDRGGLWSLEEEEDDASQQDYDNFDPAGTFVDHETQTMHRCRPGHACPDGCEAEGDDHS